MHSSLQSHYIAGTTSILRGLRTLLRDREWWTTLLALMGSCLLLQLLIITYFSVQGIDSVLRERTDLRLEVNAGATNDQIQTFFSSLRNQPFVAEVMLVTKEQAYERAQKRDPQLMNFLDRYNLENPFRDTIGVVLLSLENYQDLRTYIEQPEWRAVVNPAFLSEVTDQEQNVLELLQLTKTLRVLTGLIVSIVGGILLLTIAELVRRRVLARSAEVLIEKLVGATSLTMILPFATEATLLLLFALLASVGITILGLGHLFVAAPVLSSTGVLSPLSLALNGILETEYRNIIIVEACATPIIAFISAWIGMRKELFHRTLNFRQH